MNTISGRYYEKGSVLSGLDARVKLLFLIIYTASLYYSSGIFSLAFSFLFLLVLISVSCIPFSLFLKGLKRILLFVILLALLLVIVEDNGWRKAALTASRLVLTLLSSLLFSFTTRPFDIAHGIEKVLGRGRLKKSVHILATILTLSFRFLAVLEEEAGRIADAQISRGCSFDGKGIKGKVKAVMPLLVPLFVSSFRRADELALAMDARGFSEEGATRMYPLSYSKKDYLSYVLIVFYAVISFALERFLWL